MTAGGIAVVAARAYLATSVFAMGRAVRDDLRAELLGYRVDLPVPLALAVGVGSAASAPWPMLAVLVAAQRRAARGDRRALRTIAVLGACFFGGMAAEQLTVEVARAPKARPQHTLLVAANFAIPAAMTAGALVALAGEARAGTRAGHR